MTHRTTTTLLVLASWSWAVVPTSGAAQDVPEPPPEETSPEAPDATTPDTEPTPIETDAADTTAASADDGALDEAAAGGETLETEASEDRLHAANASELEAAAESAPETFTFGAYAEALYSFNFNEPSNGITHLRGFDNRHNTFTLANVALDAQWDYEDIIGRVTLQVGSTPATYYLAEPSLRGALGTSASDATLWQFVQQAYVGYRLPIGTGLTVSAGLYLSPIGPEGIAVRDNWNWSRSNLFFGFPFYHTGVRLSYALDDRWAVTLAGYNGWNTVLDNNEEKSIALQLTYTDPDRFVFSFVYFTGVERGTGAPEGRGWRHLFDAHATLHATEWLSFLLHVNAGFEPTTFGTSSWFASAAYARVRLLPEPRLFVAARGDVFYEHTATGAMGTASTIFWPASGGTDQYVSSATLTVEVQPVDRVSFRAEYRHDHAGSPIYFGGVVATDPVSNDFIFNRVSQDTFTLGATTWF